MEIPKEIIEKANIQMSTAIMQMMRQKSLAFDTSMVLNLEREYVTDPEALMKVKGTKLLVNPENFINLSPNDQQWNIRHTAWHVIGFDEIRKGERDADKWNLACDLWVNSLLKHDDSFNVKIPAEAAYDPRFVGWEKERIYEFLEQNDQEQEKHEQDPMQGDCGGSGQGDPEDGDDDGNSSGQGQSEEQQMQSLEKQIQNMIGQAAIQAKQAGAPVPPSVDQYLDELYNPELPWSQILMKYMTAHSNYDYSYKRINKKFFPHGILLPTMYSEGLGHVVIATDESCSVSDADLNLYLGAIKAIKDDLNPEMITVMGFTTRVEHVNVITQDEDIDKIKFRVHGGTDIPAVFDYIDKEGMQPEVLVVFSDMESRFPQKQPPYDVIWICVGNPRWKAPFGRAIYVESK